MALNSLSRDAFAHAAPFDMRQARRDPMRLVEMDMAVDERREEETAHKIDALAGVRGAFRRMERRNKAASDFNIGGLTVGKTRVSEKHQTRFRRFAATYV